MGRHSLMVARCLDPNAVPYLVDLGYVSDEASRDCADRLREAGVARSNFSIEGHARLLVRLPPTKAAPIIESFGFKPAKTYWQCTHARAELVTGEAA